MAITVRSHAAEINYQQIQISHSDKQGIYTKVEEGTYDPAGTYVLKSNKNNYIKIRTNELKGQSVADQEKAFQKKIIQFSLLFEDRVSPYKGAITTSAECFDKNSAKKILKDKKSVMMSFNTRATKNFAYGKCDGARELYFSKYTILLCRKEQKIFDIRAFTKKEENLKDFKVKCIE